MSGSRLAGEGSHAPRVVELVLTHAPEPRFLGGAAARRPPLEEGVLGWVMSHAPVDAGVPDAVQRILVTLLCRVGRVTFLDSRVHLAPGTPWSSVPGGSARVLAPGRLHALMGRPSFPLRCTRDPQVALHLFDEPAFPWCQGGQLALVSPPGGSPPALEHPLVEAAFEPRRTEKVLVGAENQPFALMRAGPDGDFAHIVVREEQAATLWSRLSESCAEVAVPLRVVDGPTFSRTRWVASDT